MSAVLRRERERERKKGKKIYIFSHFNISTHTHTAFNKSSKNSISLSCMLIILLSAEFYRFHLRCMWMLGHMWDTADLQQIFTTYPAIYIFSCYD
jgi:hypothetical protein